MARRKPTAEEQLEEVTRACNEGRAPDFSFLDEPEPNGSVAHADPESDIFTGADLTGEAVDICEEYPLPGTGKKVYVFPTTPEDLVHLLRWSLGKSEVEVNADPDVPPQVVQSVTARVTQIELRVLQAVLVCRRGPRRSAKRCFERGDAPALRRKLGNATVEEICALSDRLSGGDEAIGPGVRAFFSAALTCLTIWSSRSVGWEGCPAGLRETTERLISLVSRASSQRSLAGGLIRDLGEL